jgi:hypothetical protein
MVKKSSEFVPCKSYQVRNANNRCVGTKPKNSPTKESKTNTLKSPKPKVTKQKVTKSPVTKVTKSPKKVTKSSEPKTTKAKTSKNEISPDIINEFVRELQKKNPDILKYEKHFKKLVIPFCQLDAKIIEKCISNLPGIKRGGDKSEKKFVSTLIHYLVEDYDREEESERDDFIIRPNTDDGENSYEIRVPKYIHVFYCIMYYEYELAEEIVPLCIKNEDYQLITNLFKCKHPIIQNYMFDMFRENPKYLSVFPELPSTTEFEY